MDRSKLAFDALDALWLEYHRSLRLFKWMNFQKAIPELEQKLQEWPVFLESLTAGNEEVITQIFEEFARVFVHLSLRRFHDESA